MWYTGHKLSKWIDITIENPFKTWWRARKYFKIPRPKFVLCWNKWLAHRCYGKILELYCRDLQWKDKFDSPRHEASPYFSITLFGRLIFEISCHMYYKDEFGEYCNGDDVYWEYLLNWLYYQKKGTLKCYSTWSSDSRLYSTTKYGKADDGSEDTIIPLKSIIPCVVMSLNKKGIKALKKELSKDKELINL